MRVIHVITRLIVGGAQENTIASVIGLQQKPGLQLHLISGPTSGPEGSLQSAFANSPQSLTLLPELIRPLNPWKDVVAWSQLTRVFQNLRPEIVHTHSGKAGFLGRLAAHRAKVPIIVHTIHGPSFGPFQNPLSNCLFRFAERRAGGVTTHFVAVADSMTRQYLAAGIGQPSQYTKILSGFALSPYLSAVNDLSFRSRWNIAPDNIVIGKIARLFKLKGHDDLFTVAPTLVQSFPKVKFMLVGDGPWRERLIRQARSLNLEKHFIFTGLISPAEVPRFVGIMDLLVHLSLREGLPRALPQALAAARPVVAYDCDGAGEVCLDNETGFLVKPGNLAALTQRLSQLVDNASLRDRLGRRGQQFVSERFAVERMVDDLYALYRKLAAERGISPS